MGALGTQEASLTQLWLTRGFGMFPSLISALTMTTAGGQTLPHVPRKHLCYVFAHASSLPGNRQTSTKITRLEHMTHSGERRLMLVVGQSPWFTCGWRPITYGTPNGCLSPGHNVRTGSRNGVSVLLPRVRVTLPLTLQQHRGVGLARPYAHKCIARAGLARLPCVK